MTPPVPRGSDPGSPQTILGDTGTELASPEESPVAASAGPADSYQPWRLAINGSYLLSGEAGFPFHLGLLTRYRPLRELGLGLRLDSNFSDELNVALRLDGILPLSREFSLYAAIEGGVRALFSQAHLGEQGTQPLSGALFNMGIEAGLDIQVHPNIDLGIFGRLSFAPGGALSTRAEEPNPPAGVTHSGHEFLIGLRFGVDFGGSSTPSLAEGEDPDSPPGVRASQAITTLEEIVGEIEDDPEEAVAPSAEAPSAEDLASLRSELRNLRTSQDALQTEIRAATRVFGSLMAGQEAGTDFRMRLDRSYDDLSHRPPIIEPISIETLLNELETALRDNRDLRLLVQSSSEAFGPSLLGNLRVVQATLQRLQRRLPVAPRPSDGLSRASLDPIFPRFSAVLTILEDLRRRTVNSQPSTNRIALWREGLASLERQIGELAPRLNAEQRDQLEGEFRRLNESFASLIGDLEENERLWLISRATYGHYMAFTEARRPDPAGAALTAMLAELQGAPESFRDSHRRGLENLRVVLSAFVERRSSEARWRVAREAAIAVVQWIDPTYTSPPVVRPRRSRSAGSGSTGAASPSTRSGGTGTGRTGGGIEFHIPEDRPEDAEAGE